MPSRLIGSRQRLPPVSYTHLTKAAERIAEAQYRFEEQNPDYQLALEGDANGAGFLDVIEEYG